MICYALAMGKQHLGPHVVVGYGIKIFFLGLSITSPDHLVITQLCPFYVHKHGFIVHNRFITINRWSVVHYGISLQRTSLQWYIVCFARYCCRTICRQDIAKIVPISRWFIVSMRCFADISAINCERSEQNAFFVDYRLHYFCTVL